ncbi:hypothetical protein GOP47_0008036 [Adiantum capillus-veneris]|uniref:Uncharacterized protein n=1 Tax=Adiantum capillus-veneris TaxID=13818 RepID=A0A9D4ZK24_ADICA|nr:hypothetical protein GOP47_0008036 [Adiantum capillus-veneris]
MELPEELLEKVIPLPSDDDSMQASSSDDYNVESYDSSSSNSYEDEMSIMQMQMLKMLHTKRMCNPQPFQILV